MTEADAEAQALIEWRQVAEESQQSSDPSRISAQQSSDLGRIILAFANTPMQYARIQKRAIQDLINGRGDAKTHVSKIIYYGFIQNVIFHDLQQDVFDLGFGRMLLGSKYGLSVSISNRLSGIRGTISANA